MNREKQLDENIDLDVPLERTPAHQDPLPDGQDFDARNQATSEKCLQNAIAIQHWTPNGELVEEQFGEDECLKGYFEYWIREHDGWDDVHFEQDSPSNEQTRSVLIEGLRELRRNIEWRQLFRKDIAARRVRSAARAKATRNDELAQKVRAVREQLQGVTEHPKLSVARALKKFMSHRAWKFEKQTAASEPSESEKRLTAGDHLVLAGRARKLAERLADREQVEQCIRELHDEANQHAELHRRKLADCMNFWYGPEGLFWLARKRQIALKDWAHYADFMDDEAKQAFQSCTIWHRWYDAVLPDY